MGLLAITSSWVALAALGGFVGGRFDHLTCLTMRRFGEQLQQPENHDISRALVASLYSSTSRFLRRFGTVNPFPMYEELIERCLEAVEWSVSDEHEPSVPGKKMVELVHNNMVRFLQRVENESDSIESMKVKQILTDGLLAWLEDESNQEVPDLLKSVFTSGGTLNGERVDAWHEYFQKELSERLKENDRFEKIFSVELAANTNIKVSNALVKIDDAIELLDLLITKDRTQLFRTAVANRPLSGRFIMKSLGTRDAVLDDVDWSEIEVGRRFKIEHQLSWDGYSIFMQRLNGQWKPTPILKPDIYVRETTLGICQFPFDAFLFEIDKTAVGDRLFVVLNSKSEIPESITTVFRANDVLTDGNINELAEFLLSSPSGEIEMHVSKCRFVPPQQKG